MNFKNNFSETLFKLRKSNKLSLQKLGDAIGITNQAVSTFEKGRNSPSFEVLCSIAEYFDVSIDYLVGRTDNPDSHKN